MIYDAGTLALPLQVKADLCVIGAGAGGAMVAMVAAEAGLSVVVLEAGEFLTPADMVQREEVMFPRLYWDSGGRTTADRAVHIPQGKGVAKLTARSWGTLCSISNGRILSGPYRTLLFRYVLLIKPLLLRWCIVVALACDNLELQSVAF